MQTALARVSQSAILEERNRLAGEIHDGLAQKFTAICMQLGVAKEELSSKEGDPLCSIQRAVELAKFGLAEARRCAHNLRLSNESGLAVALQRLVEGSSVAGRLRCTFRSSSDTISIVTFNLKRYRSVNIIWRTLRVCTSLPVFPTTTARLRLIGSG
jgi:signal transduction histidine kinase